MSFLASDQVQRAQPARLAAFGLVYCALHVGTIFLRHRFPAGLTVGDWISLLDPWLVMGSAFLVWDTTPASVRHRPALTTLLLASALLYTTGYGINLSANAIARFVVETAPTQPSVLIYFLDEHLGHVLWHLGMIGTTVALIIAARGATPQPVSPGVILGAVAYAFAYFTDAVEGQTVPILLPVSIVLVGALAVSRVRPRPLLYRFMLLAHGLALLQFVIWRIWQGGFPQFSDVGMI